MTRRAQLRWAIGAILLILLVLGIGFLLIPTAFPTPLQTDVVVMDDLEPKNVKVYRPSAPAAPVAQPVPLDTEIPHKHQDQWDQAHDRADWVGGATVTCDLGDLAGEASNAFIEMDRGMDPDGAVDVLSRMWSPIVESRVTFVVTEAQGEARALLFNNNATANEDGTPPNRVSGTPVRIQWTGATEGKTVGCSAAYQTETATIILTIEDSDGNELKGFDDPDGEANMPAAVVVRGCGVMLPLFSAPLEIDTEAGKCAIQVERRNSNFPLIVARGKTYVINLQPGETRELTAVAPDEPPLYQPPDLVEISAAADMAAYFGADAAADALESLVNTLASGEWNPETVQDIVEELAASRGPPRQELTDEELDALIEEFEEEGGPVILDPHEDPN